MNVVKVLNNQSLIDLSVQLTGTVVNVVRIARENNLSITDELSSGQIIQIPEGLPIDFKVLEFYKTKGLKPATGLTDKQKNVVDDCEGIGCWAIGFDFIVS